MVSKANLWVVCSLLILMAAIGCQPASAPPEGGLAATLAATQANPTALPLPTPQPSPTPPAHLQVDPQGLKGLEIVFAVPWSGTTEKATADLVAEFNRTNLWGIRVRLIATGSEGLLIDYVEANLKTKESPHLVAAPIEQLMLWQQNFNAVINLNDYISSPQWGLSAEETEAYYPEVWEQDSWEGRQLGLPALRTAPVLIYNQTWAKELGFKQPPTTTADFEKQVCAAASAVKLQRNDGTGGWIVNTSSLSALNWLNSFGAIDVGDVNAEVQQFNTPEARAALTYLRDLFDSGCAWNSRISLPYDYFNKRQTLIYSAALEDIPAQASIQKKSENRDEWLAIPYPSDSGQPFFFLHGPSYAILVDGPQKQLASWLFIRWISAPERQAKLAFAAQALPVGPQAAELMQKNPRISPQWKSIFSQLTTAQPAPGSPSWPIARAILADAVWQAFQANTTVEKVPTILQQVDSTLGEILRRME